MLEFVEFEKFLLSDVPVCTMHAACDDFNRSKNHGQTLWSRMSLEQIRGTCVCVFMLLWF